jgi:DNA-binding MarR family transcriptional regulator
VHYMEETEPARHARPMPGSLRAAPGCRAEEERWAELADLVLIIGRELFSHRSRDEQGVALTPSESLVMCFLYANQVSAPSGIAAATGLQRTNLSAVLRGLEEKGLIERRGSPGDGRGVTVHRTDRGIRNSETARRERANVISDAVGGDDTYLDAAVELLTGIEAGLASMRSAAPGRPA